MFFNSRVSQWGGAAFILGNILFIVNKLDEMSHLFFGRWMPDVISGETMLLMLIGQVALIIGYIVYYQYYVSRAKRSAKYALRLFCGGGIVLSFGHLVFTPVSPFEGLFLLVFVGLAVMLVGLIWFGIVTVRQPILGRWQWLPLATGLMGFVGFFLFRGEEITATFLFFRTLFGLGLMGLGFVLSLEKPVQTLVTR
jgi:hypothetical protein